MIKISLATAKKYINRGLSIFPVDLSVDESGKIQKKPAVAWKDYQTRLATEEELSRWFETEFHNGLGLATGKLSRVVVVDVEANATDEDIKGIESTLVSNTISGGKHFFYRWNHDIRNTVKIEGKPIDFRGDGGYVVLPPSNFGDKKYSWDKTDFDGLSDLPEWLETMLTTRTEEVKPAIYQDLDGEEGFRPAEKGERNMVAAQVAGSLCQGMKRKLWNPYGWLAFKDWNEKNTEPLSERELHIIWDSITKTDLRNNPLQDITPEKHNIYTGQMAVTVAKKMREEYQNGIETGFEYLDKYFSFMPEQLYLLSAETHIGKTTFALNLCGRVASMGHNVLFASLEQGLFIVPRVESMLGGPFPDKLSILTSDKMASVQAIRSTIEGMAQKPELLCVDHLHFMKMDGVGMMEDTDKIMFEFQSMARELKIPIILIAHMRKTNHDNMPDIDDLKSSSSLGQVPSVVLILYRKRITSIEKANEENSYFSQSGALIIAKNRIQGRTGIVKFELASSGEFNFMKMERKDSQTVKDAVEIFTGKPYKDD